MGRRCQAVDVADTIEEILKLYPAPTHKRLENGPEFIGHSLESDAQAMIQQRRASRQVLPGKLPFWSR